MLYLEEKNCVLYGNFIIKITFRKLYPNKLKITFKKKVIFDMVNKQKIDFDFLKNL